MKVHFYRRIDELGRIVLPSDCLRELEWDCRTHLSIRPQDNGLLIYPTREACIFCGWETDLTKLRDRYVCAVCMQEIRKERPAP